MSLIYYPGIKCIYLGHIIQQRATALRPTVTRRSRRMPLQAWNVCRLGTRQMLQQPVPQTALPLGRSSRRIRLKDERVFLVNILNIHVHRKKIPYLSVLYVYIYICMILYLPIGSSLYRSIPIIHIPKNHKWIHRLVDKSPTCLIPICSVYLYSLGILLHMRIRSFIQHQRPSAFGDPRYRNYGYPGRPKSAWKDSLVACFRRVASSVPWFENSVRTMLAALQLNSPLSCKAKHFILNRVPVDASSADQT